MGRLRYHVSMRQVVQRGTGGIVFIRPDAERNTMFKRHSGTFNRSLDLPDLLRGSRSKPCVASLLVRSFGLLL